VEHFWVWFILIIFKNWEKEKKKPKKKKKNTHTP